MAAFITSGGEELLKTCPYNKVHKVKPSRYQIHIAQCRKLYDNHLVDCPFDYNHKIPRGEMDAHKLSCPAAAQFLRQKQEEKNMKPIGPLLPRSVPAPSALENWNY